MPEAATGSGARQVGRLSGRRNGLELAQKRRGLSRVCRSFPALILLACFFGGGCARTHVTLTVSAAASLKDALAEAETAYSQSQSHVGFVNNFASSGTLAAQIDQGAPVDVFLSAASRPMDDLESKGLIAAGTRRNLLRNSLVLIAPPDSGLRGFEGLAYTSIRSIALGDPASVPAGEYARQTLGALHLLDKLKPKLVMGADVRQVLTFVETGNADAGLVYLTDAQASGKVRVVAVAPESVHDPIVYPAAVVKGCRGEEAARKFVEYLGSPAAQAIFVRHGFTMAAQ
jgi:molybdate transport system substrate-binding protein